VLPGLRTIEQASFWSPSSHQFEIQATHSDWVAFSVLCMNKMMCNDGSVNTYGYFMQTFFEEGAWLWKSGSEWHFSSVKGQTDLLGRRMLEQGEHLAWLRWGTLCVRACASLRTCFSPSLFFPFNFSDCDCVWGQSFVFALGISRSWIGNSKVSFKVER